MSELVVMYKTERLDKNTPPQRLLEIIAPFLITMQRELIVMQQEMKTGPKAEVPPCSSTAKSATRT